MAIRSAAKAAVVRDGRILLQHCYAPSRGDYYDLPGGGQQPYESLMDTVIRECLEETGYTVVVDRFLALAEEIVETEAFRERYPDYAHRVIHVFLCRLADVPQGEPTEKDYDQVDLEWVELSRLPEIQLIPVSLRGALPELLAGGAPRFVGTDRYAGMR